MKTKNEIDEYIKKWLEVWHSKPSRWAGMSYEAGIEAALNWVLDDGEDPMED